MSKKINMVGKKYNRLTVVEECKERDKHGQIVYKCQCDCGKIHFVVGGQLRNGNIKSCGCSRKGKTFIKHGKTHTRIYNIYKAMKARCYYKKHKEYT